MTGSAPPLLQVEGISAWYVPRRPVLAIDAFTIGERSVLGLLGRNGSGKTTLINTLVAVHDRCQVNTVTFPGQPGSLSQPRLRQARYAVFTDHEGFAAWSFDAYLRFVSGVFPQGVDRDVVDALVAGFAFEPFRQRPIGALSTGNAKKAFLIAGLALRRPLLILDEPIDGLDFDATEYLYEAVNAYREHGAVLMSSHIAESFTRCCDHLVVLEDGNLSAPLALNADTDVRSLLRARP